MSTPESLLLSSVCDYLELKRYSFWRCNNGAVYDNKIQGFRKMPKHAMKGVSDIILLHNGSAYFIELKSKTGVQSKDQKKFQKFVREAGCKYFLVRSIDDLIRYGF